MSAKMREALCLLAENGGVGDVRHDGPTELVHGTVCMNLRTALALDALGFVGAFEQADWELWGSVELQPAGERAAGALREAER